jgi:hypothetical protein
MVDILAATATAQIGGDNVPNSRMTSMQLLLAGPDRDTADVCIVPNPDGRPPYRFDDPLNNIRVPRLGPKSLIHLAALALREGYRLIGFELIDSRGQLVRDEDEQSRISEQLVVAIGKGNEENIREGLALMAHDFLFCEVVGVDLYKKGFISVRRNGVLFTEEPDEVQQFFKAHWTEVVS